MPRRHSWVDVLRLWQLAHRTSHFSISCWILFQGNPRLTSVDTSLKFRPAHVVEFKHDWVAFTTIDATVFIQEVIH